MATTTWTPKATITQRDGEIKLDVSWIDPTGAQKLDRPSTGGWAFDGDDRGMRMALRLQACINAGKAYGPPEVVRDVNGKTYVQAETAGFFHKRHMNTSLLKLGF